MTIPTSRSSRRTGARFTWFRSSILAASVTVSSSARAITGVCMRVLAVLMERRIAPSRTGSRSASDSIPTTWFPSTTGAPLMRRSRKSRATSFTSVCGVTVTTSTVMTSRTRIIGALRLHGARREAALPRRVPCPRRGRPSRS